jgi:large subunit ribosomal protein L10
MKEQVVAQLHEKMRDSSIAIVAEYRGLDVETVTAIRAKCRENGVDYKVVKNTLAKLAAKGTPVESIADAFVGPVVLMLGADPVTPAKLMSEFAKENEGKLVPRVGVAQGEKLDPKGLEALAKMPSLEELRATLVGLVAAPASKLVRVLAAPGQQLARVLDARREKLAS